MTWVERLHLLLSSICVMHFTVVRSDLIIGSLFPSCTGWSVSRVVSLYLGFLSRRHRDPSSLFLASSPEDCVDPNLPFQWISVLDVFSSGVFNVILKGVDKSGDNSRHKRPVLKSYRSSIIKNPPTLDLSLKSPTCYYTYTFSNPSKITSYTFGSTYRSISTSEIFRV